MALLRLQANPFAGETPIPIQIGDTVITGLHGVCEPDLERPVDGAGVAASGYPLQNSALVTNAGGIASAWLTDREAAALLRLEDPHTRESADRYLADLEVNGGNSGGPVYRVDTGRVIGVCRATQSAPVTFGDEEGGAVIPEGRGPLVYSSGLTVVVPAKYVAKFLDENGLAWAGRTAISQRSTSLPERRPSRLAPSLLRAPRSAALSSSPRRIACR